MLNIESFLRQTFLQNRRKKITLGCICGDNILIAVLEFFKSDVQVISSVLAETLGNDFLSFEVHKTPGSDVIDSTVFRSFIFKLLQFFEKCTHNRIYIRTPQKTDKKN